MNEQEQRVELQKQLASLQYELAKPLTKQSLDAWVAVSKDRPSILKDTVWGTIRWKKIIGRPLSASLSMAFTITHVHFDTVVYVTSSGKVKSVVLTAPHPEPSIWDGPHDNEYYRVSFLAYIRPDRPNQFSVRFAPSAHWEQVVNSHHLRVYRRLTPTELTLMPTKSITVLDAFEVTYEPL